LPNQIFISDEINEVYAWLIRHGVKPTVSETAVAMYFITGYVPQGMCIFDSIGVCRNTEIYKWDGNVVKSSRTFLPILPDKTTHISAVESAIDEEISLVTRSHPELDAWCSGGIDSSTIAYLHNIKGRKAELLTLSYGQALIASYGEGEIPHARTMATACGMPLRTVEMEEELFKKVHTSFVTGHHSPVIDTCLLAKYALASATRKAAVTGEGGDPIFGGVKNDFVSYYQYRNPNVPIGQIYSLSHKRFGPNLPDIMVRGSELNQFSAE
jgi:asparagine synthetase B (glutamine-hydrolysing)